MLQFITGIVIIAFGTVGLFSVQRRFSNMERRHLWAGLVAYYGAALFNIWLISAFFGGVSDLMKYHREALRLVALMHQDFGLYGTEVLRLFFQRDLATTIHVFGAGSSTGSMSAVLAMVFYLFGDSLYVASLLFATGSFFASVAMYWAFRQFFAVEYRRALLWAAVLLPSGVFWTAGFSKELFAVAGLGLLLFGLYLMLVQGHNRLIGFLFVAVGGWLVAMFKGFILIAIVAAMAAYYYAVRRRKLKSPKMRALTPLYMALAFAVAVGGLLVIGEVFPRFSLEQMTEEIAHGQEAGARGGSAIHVGDPQQRSLAGQLAFAPVAVVNSLFRPFLFEAHNPVALANALETTVLTVLLFLAVVRLGIRRILRAILNSPVLLGSLILVLILGVGVGLATANMGTLSRYRTPMMPFWVLIIGVLYTWSRKETG